MRFQQKQESILEEKLRAIEIDQLTEMDKVSKSFYEIHKKESIGNKAMELILKERQELWDQSDNNLDEEILILKKVQILRIRN